MITEELVPGASSTGEFRGSESTGSDLLVSSFWSIFSHGPKKVSLLLSPLGRTEPAGSSCDL